MPGSSVLDDFDLSFLLEAARLVDSKLALLELEERGSEDPDGRGIFDRAEHIMGFGLVACQTYVTASASRFRLDWKQALALGPRHECGHSIVYLVNALANYWKHSPEWTPPLSKRAQETLNAISKLGVDVESSYPTTNALATLLRPHPPQIERVVPFLKQWRGCLQDSA